MEKQQVNERIAARVERVMRAAAGRWRAILAACGVPEQGLDGKGRPCPICGGTDRFVFDDKWGRGNFFCRRCGAGDGIELVRRYCDVSFMQALEMLERCCSICVDQKERPRAIEPHKKRLHGHMQRLWSQAKPLTEGDPVWRYLSSRGLDARRAGSQVRYHAKLPYFSARSDGPNYCAMLARVSDHAGRMINLHRTFLTADGHKAAVKPCKKLLPMPLKGGAVRIGPKPDTELGFAEGIETAMAAYVMTGLPVWAALGCSNLEKMLRLPASIKRVVVFADNDAQFAGQKAAYALAHALSLRQVQVQVRVPEQTGTDWLDVYNAQCNG